MLCCGVVSVHKPLSRSVSTLPSRCVRPLGTNVLSTSGLFLINHPQGRLFILSSCLLRPLSVINPQIHPSNNCNPSKFLLTNPIYLLSKDSLTCSSDPWFSLFGTHYCTCTLTHIDLVFRLYVYYPLDVLGEVTTGVNGKWF